MAEVPFEALAKLAATKKVKAVAAWCARNRVLTFRDTKGRPCTTEAPLSQSNQNTGKSPSFGPTLRDLGTHGRYQIIKVKVRGKRELRYVRA